MLGTRERYERADAAVFARRRGRGGNDAVMDVRAVPVQLASGAVGRWTNDVGSSAVVLVDGGRAAEVPGTWSATLEWLVRRLAPEFPELAFLEVRYRVKSWHRFDSCVDDAAAALADATDRGAARCLLVGFSLGGAVAVAVAQHPAVTTVVGLAPWFPDRLDLSPLRGRRLAVVHGTLDRSLPGLPGVRPRSSREGFDRARTLGVASAAYRLIPGGVHGAAVRSPHGLLRLPRAERWAQLLAEELRLFSAS